MDKAADYIDNNQERLQYAKALGQGRPIATGGIEVACRHLVKDRMNITGARGACSAQKPFSSYAR